MLAGRAVDAAPLHAATKATNGVGPHARGRVQDALLLVEVGHAQRGQVGLEGAAIKFHSNAQSSNSKNGNIKLHINSVSIQLTWSIFLDFFQNKINSIIKIISMLPDCKYNYNFK